MWSYGVTTVPKRRATLLPGTLASLAAAGFGSPRLFVDGDGDGPSWEREFGLEVTAHGPPPLLLHGAWVLALYELFVRRPKAEFYALFQDDVIACRNLREYLEAHPWPAGGYANLYVEGRNEGDASRAPRGRWWATNQKGWGALGLAFRREEALKLLASDHMLRRPLDPNRGWRFLDGGVVESMRKAGIREYCHSPSLVQHTGSVSTFDKLKRDGHGEDRREFVWPQHRFSQSFPGADFDCLTLLGESQKGVEMSDRLKSILAFFRPLPECKVSSDDRTDVLVEWQDSPAVIRYFDTPQGVRVEFVGPAPAAPAENSPPPAAL